MKSYKAYTQATMFDEKFYVEDNNEHDLIIMAETSYEAHSKFIDYIFENSLYSFDETKAMLNKTPIFIEEV